MAERDGRGRSLRARRGAAGSAPSLGPRPPPLLTPESSQPRGAQEGPGQGLTTAKQQTTTQREGSARAPQVTARAVKAQTARSARGAGPSARPQGGETPREGFGWAPWGEPVPSQMPPGRQRTQEAAAMSLGLREGDLSEHMARHEFTEREALSQVRRQGDGGEWWRGGGGPERWCR